MNQKIGTGLSESEASARLKSFGRNRIFEPEKVGFFGIAARELAEPMIILLLVVGFLYGIWGELDDAITIFAVIFLLVLAEVINEFRAKKAISSLERISAPKTRVIREGFITEIDSENIVPGDVLILVEGAKISADAVVIEGDGLQIDESALTGESFPVDKNRGDSVFAGTAVVSGEGRAEVFMTGRATSIGRIAEAVKRITPPRTALQAAMKKLSGRLVYVAIFLSVLVAAIGILEKRGMETMILTGLSLAFATIPEELPIVITMVLGFGSYALSKHNFFIKKISAAETLGNATVIVTDKTGTITEGRMKIVLIYPDLGDRGKDIMAKALNAFSEFSFSSIEKEIMGKASELGLGGPVGEIVRQRNFGGGRKTRTVIRNMGGGEFLLFATGAPEEIFGMCGDYGVKLGGLREELRLQAAAGRRIIGTAWKKLEPGEESAALSEIEKGLHFSGLICFEDPPRSGVKHTIETAASAGIRTIMVTGDHPLTAGYIAREAGIIGDGGMVISADGIDGMDEEGLSEAVKSVSVFARTTPQHKYRIVQALRKNREVVAVTGDGINDVLALRSADIGIAMGIRGTDVAKEAADIILADDNYVTIARGIFEGRKFFDNLRKGIKYYLSVKVSLVLIFILSIIMGMPLPMMPIQIIILELFMDLAASTSFVAEPEEKNIYSRPPRDPSENIIDKAVVKEIFLKGGILFLMTGLVYFYAVYGGLDSGVARTMVFSALVSGYVALIYVSRSDDEPLFSSGIFSNRIINMWSALAAAFLVLVIYVPFLREMFHFNEVSPFRLLFTASFAVAVIGLLEVRKILVLRLKKVTG